MARQSLGRKGRALCAFVALAAGCRALGGGGGSVVEQNRKLNEEETGETLAVRLSDFALRFAAVTENAADEIRARSQDPRVRKAALAWKSEAIPECFLACFRPNPLGGLYDVWALAAQIRDHFRDGNAKDAFGDQQAIAVQASESLVAAAETMARAALGDDRAFQASAAEVRELEQEQPLGKSIAGRLPALDRFVRFGQLEHGTMDTIASVEH